MTLMEKREFERLRSKTLTEQLNIPVEPELKERLRRLKSEKRINTAAVIRKAIWDLLPELEQAAS